MCERCGRLSFAPVVVQRIEGDTRKRIGEPGVLCNDVGCLHEWTTDKQEFDEGIIIDRAAYLDVEVSIEVQR
jgi:hypothetical protein